MWDVFVCHASEDKHSVAIPLAEALRAQGLRVWIDEWELTVGDSLVEAIDQGLAASRFGVVVISPSFFRKRWPQRELNGLATRELAAGGKVILPVWHEVTRDEVLAYSPPLANVVAASTVESPIEAVAQSLVRAVRKATSGSPDPSSRAEWRQPMKPREVERSIREMEADRERILKEIHSLLGDGIDDNIALPWVRARRAKEAQLAQLDQRLQVLRARPTGIHRCYRCKALMSADEWLDGQCRECGYINEVD
ncbi:MAG TPA: toll/interleukin-1 receptor domain-containing protein [Acidimicrobiales bacterium]|nr:toll/interleukin-1 receptor domain-containing protein [Acidimicrobiales bacterium]